MKYIEINTTKEINVLVDNSYLLNDNLTHSYKDLREKEIKIIETGFKIPAIPRYRLDVVIKTTLDTKIECEGNYYYTAHRFIKTKTITSSSRKLYVPFPLKDYKGRCFIAKCGELLCEDCFYDNQQLWFDSLSQ